MKKLKYCTVFIITGFLFSCGNSSPKETNESDEQEAVVETPAPKCNYSLESNATSVYWTAYKHSAKIAVKGMMDSVVVSGTETASSAMSALAGGKVLVYTTSVNSKDDARDKKLREIYFGSMANTEIIEGNFKSWEGTDEAGTCVLTLRLNDNAQEVSGAYTVEDNIVQIRFTIEPNNWGAEEAIAKLGEACAEKHTGEDGKTIFWPDVDLLIEVALNKDCPDTI